MVDYKNTPVFCMVTLLAMVGASLADTPEEMPVNDANPKSLVRYYEIMSIPKPLLPRTGDDFLKHRDEIREKLLKSTRLFPLPQRVPLDPRYSEPLEHPWCKVYKVAYQLWPEIYSVGLLYVPKELPQIPVPGILCPHGHFQNGYYSETVQSRCLGLAKLGFVVFATPNDHYNDIPRGVTDQTHQIWRNIRGLDFLQSLPEVDPQRLGACGCSGGGTQVQMLISLDDRVKAATIAGLTCDFREISFLTWPCCVCNYFPDVMRFTDQPEISALGMPCPVQYLTMNDWTKTFETDTFPQIKALYAAHGDADLVECRYENTDHEYGRVKREWTYWWMDKHLRDNSLAESGTEPDELHLFDLKTLQDLEVTKPGQPLSALSDLYREKDAALGLTPDRDALRDMLGVDRALPPERRDVQILSETNRDGLTIRKVMIPGEGPLGIPAIVLVKQDVPQPHSVAIVLDKDGTAMSFDAEETKTLLDAGCLVVIPDIRFVGGMSFDPLSDGKADPHRTYIPSDSIYGDAGSSDSTRSAWNWMSVWWGRPITGMSVTDIHFAVDFAQTLCSDAKPQEIRLIARNSGELAVAALFAALLNPKITKLDVDFNEVSYKTGRLPFVSGILRYGDIPQWRELLESVSR